MEQEIMDYQLQAKMRNSIHNSNFDYQLRTLANCGCIVDITNGTHILSNGKQAKILGTRFCNNSWGCPSCTPRKMSKLASKVSVTIDALARQNKAAIMITFTVFHTNQYTLDEILELLMKTYTSWNKNAFWKRQKKDGTWYTKGGLLSKFYDTFKIRHYIRSLEITYGEHGWHPHLHCLYFIDKQDLDKVSNWEKDLLEYWRKLEDSTAKKLFTQKKYKVRKFLHEKHDKKETHHGLYISKDKDGNIMQIKSGDYICGWGGGQELTGGSQSLKIANDGHYTLLQMIREAIENNNNELFEKYAEAMITLFKRKQHKIDFSRTGLKKIIADYMNTEGYKEILKKKRSQGITSKNINPFYTVCWFNKQQWLDICMIEKYQNIPLRFLILCFSCYDNGYDLICELCIVNNLEPPLRKHPANIDIAKSFNEICGITA